MVGGMARIAALLVIAVFAAAPAAALAAQPPDPTQSPFQQTAPQNQIEEQPGETQAPAPAPAPQQQAQLDDGSIGGKELLLIGAGIVALIGGIWFVIARDAKRVTAGRVPAADGGSVGRSATRASRRSRRLSAAERKRRKRGRATK
jgi:hypothetical protein